MTSRRYFETDIGLSTINEENEQNLSPLQAGNETPRAKYVPNKRSRISDSPIFPQKSESNSRTSILEEMESYFCECDKFENAMSDYKILREKIQTYTKSKNIDLSKRISDINFSFCDASLVPFLEAEMQVFAEETCKCERFKTIIKEYNNLFENSDKLDDKFDENEIVKLKEELEKAKLEMEEYKKAAESSKNEVSSLQEALKNANVEISALKEKHKICEQKEDESAAKDVEIYKSIFPEEEVSEFVSHDFTFQSTETAAAESSQSSEAVESILKEIRKESTEARNSSEKENVESEIEVLQTENQILKQSQEVGQREPAECRQQEEAKRQLLQRGSRAAHRPRKPFNKAKNSERERGRKCAAESAARKKQRQKESLIGKTSL